ncbi:MAG: hypothetical protein AAF578_03665 [Pseudomonadota bacterium]|mgnify:CR=1 FL=1
MEVLTLFTPETGAVRLVVLDRGITVSYYKLASTGGDLRLRTIAR